MFSVRWIKPIVLFATLLLVSLGLAGCEGITDDLAPSSDDNRPVVDTSVNGTQVGQTVDNFFLTDTEHVDHGLYDELSRSTAVVLYFTMWCPVCNAHASHMRAEVIPNFPTVQFFLVDFVSATITDSRISQLANGYGDIETLVDTGQVVFDLYDASMGTTVVIDSAGNIVRMNEDYKDGDKLIKTLEAL